MNNLFLNVKSGYTWVYILHLPVKIKNYLWIIKNVGMSCSQMCAEIRSASACFKLFHTNRAERLVNTAFSKILPHRRVRHNKPASKPRTAYTPIALHNNRFLSTVVKQPEWQWQNTPLTIKKETNKA